MAEAPLCGDYGHRNKAGNPCGAFALSGARGCLNHVGKSLAKVRAEVAVKRAVLAWDLDQPTVDPGETLLRLLTVTAGRARWYADLLQQAYDAAERLRAAARPPLADVETDAGQDAARDLDEVLARGGVSVLVGRTYAADRQAGVFATGEALRGLAKLEQDERTRAVDFAAKAIAAGIAERQVRLAEMHADLWIRVLIGAAARAGIDVDNAVVSLAVEQELAALPAEAIMPS